MTLLGGPGSAEHENLRLRASSPGTPPGELADLAYRFEDLRPAVAANPSAYPGLLDWLASLGDPRVAAALQARAAGGWQQAAPGVQAAAPAAGQAAAQPFPDAAAADPFPDAGRHGGRRPSRKLVVGIAAGTAALLALGGAGAFAFTSFMTAGFASATESAKAFPASTYTWAELALDPSAGQKVAALELLGNLPEISDTLEESGVDLDADGGDLKEGIVTALFQYYLSVEPEFDYEEDVQPWLGSRVALGQTSAGTTPRDSNMLAIEATDPQRGVESVAEILEQHDFRDLQVTARSGYVLVASGEVDLEAAFARGTLADTAAMKAASAKLGGWGLATVWTSPRAAFDAHLAWTREQWEADGSLSLAGWEERYRGDVEDWEAQVEDYKARCPVGELFVPVDCGWTEPSPDGFFDSYGYYPSEWQQAAEEGLQEYEAVLDSAGAVQDQLAEAGSVSAVVRIVDGSVELFGSTANLRLPEFRNPQNPAAIAALPDTTAAAASVSQAGSIIDTLLSPEYFGYGFAAQFPFAADGSTWRMQSLVDWEGNAFPKTVENWRTSYSDSIEQFGWTFPDDLLDVFGSNAVVAVDRDFNCWFADLTYGAGGCEEPSAGVLIYSDDPGETEEAIEDVLDSYQQNSEIVLETDSSDGKVAVFRGGYGDVLLERGGTLGERPGFATALPDLNSSFAAAYLDLGAVTDVLTAQQDPSVDPTPAVETVEGVDAIGLTMSKAGGGDIAFRLRLVTLSDE
jgi:Protein of unknown function (DUF3352)